MKTFKQFILEYGYDVPIVTIDKMNVDLDDDNTINEINKNLSITMARDFNNAEEGLNAAKKILTMYGIELPHLEFKNKTTGTISVPISQFSSSGENHYGVTPPFGEKTENHKFEYTYKQIDGRFDTKAKVIPL